ncbi:TorD/DmsD family molecular chaperone [Roseovarius sp. 2305UL8-3]|uniref:TorD/DmsD family molecular chaperone n=1 Tax=Roseovarius conchicola TaxID=3121636 RepID=UPI0035278C0F
MTEYVPLALSYRWLAQFFLSPPSAEQLEQYRGPDGQQVLSACRSVPALAPVVGLLDAMIAPGQDLEAEQKGFARAFSQAFDVGGPRSAPPYASVYVSERGLLCQEPTREMNRILSGLQMTLPGGVNEPSDHIAIQLHVAAELCDREQAGQHLPIPTVAFLEQHLLNWLPEFADRCARLSGPPRISLLTNAALDLVRADIKERRKDQPDHEQVARVAQSALGAIKATY